MKVTKENGVRPAGDPDKCFYCDSKIGEDHKYECVIPTKKVVIRYTIDLPVEVPISWDKEQIEFHRNDGTWCASNITSEIEEYDKKHGCICGITKAELFIG